MAYDRDDEVIVKQDRGPSIWFWLLIAAVVIIVAIILYAWLTDDEEVEPVDPADEGGAQVIEGAFAAHRLDRFEVAGIEVMVA